MIREVPAADGRSWTVRREINWSRPSTDHQFEHDVAAGNVAGVAMATVVVLMVIVVMMMAWRLPPGQVYGRDWLPLVFLAVMMLIPLQWAMARPWTIVAHTYEPLDSFGEQWRGTTHGILASRRAVGRVVRSLQHDGIPDDGRGLLERLEQEPAP